MAQGATLQEAAHTLPTITIPRCPLLRVSEELSTTCCTAKSSSFVALQAVPAPSDNWEEYHVTADLEGHVDTRRGRMPLIEVRKTP